MTKRDNFMAIRDLLVTDPENAELVAAMDREIELIDNRKTAPRKPTATQVENIALKADIVIMLTDTEGMTATDIAKELDVTVQKASALLRQLVTDGTVAKTEAKGKEKATFTV
jgi:predicted transcriptional regulator